MNVSQFRIRNILGIEALDITPGKVTVLKGRNATGKTSVLEAIRTVIKGGHHDATLIRQGAEEGEVVLILDNGVEITKTITPHRSKIEATHPEMGRVRAPVAWLRGQFDDLFNPVEFLVSDRQRVQMLLEAMPMSVDDDLVRRIGEAIPVPVFGAQQTANQYRGGHALEAIAAVRKGVFEARTGVNATARKAETAALKLAESLPVENVAPSDIEAAQAAYDEARTEAAADIRALGEIHEDSIAEVRRDYTDRIANLQAKIHRTRSEQMAKERELDEQKAERVAAIHGTAGPRLQELKAAVEVARERETAEALHENTRKLIAEQEAERDASWDEASGLTKALTNLDVMRGDLTNEIPIAGVEIIDGKLYRDGTPFHRLNRAAQVRLALDVALLRAGNVPLIIMDGLENLDAENFAALDEALADIDDVQLIVTRVADEPFAVEAR